MAIQIVASVGKKVGQPNYGSKSFNLSCTKEITDLGTLEAESIKLHRLLEQIVEAQIDKDERDEITEHVAPVNRIHSNGTESNNHNDDQWNCSPKQASLITTLLKDHGLENEAEQLSQQLWKLPVRSLNKMQASGLIENLLTITKQAKPRSRTNGRHYANGGAK
jgi:hypothetical protein